MCWASCNSPIDVGKNADCYLNPGAVYQIVGKYPANLDVTEFCVEEKVIQGGLLHYAVLPSLRGKLVEFVM